MKRIISILLAMLLAFSALFLSGCTASKQCEYDSLMEELEKIKTAVPESDSDEEEDEKINCVTACIYGDTDRYYDVKVTDDFISLFDGEFTKADGFDGKKILSVTLSMQYEITFFENDGAMIYYGFCDVLQSDRQYYKFNLKGGVDALREYILNNGTVSDIEKEN